MTLPTYNDFRFGSEYGYMYCTYDSLIEEDLDGESLYIYDPHDFTEDIDKKLMSEGIKEVLSSLTDRERKVITHRFGLFGEKEKTLDQVGELFHVTKERIRQIEAKALRKLRHPSRSQKLLFFSKDSSIDLRPYEERVKKKYEEYLEGQRKEEEERKEWEATRLEKDKKYRKLIKEKKEKEAEKQKPPSPPFKYVFTEAIVNEPDDAIDVKMAVLVRHMRNNCPGWEEFVKTYNMKIITNLGGLYVYKSDHKKPRWMYCEYKSSFMFGSAWHLSGPTEKMKSVPPLDVETYNRWLKEAYDEAQKATKQKRVFSRLS